MQRRPITQTGYERLRQKLRQMQTEERRAVAEEIEIARGHGDLRENADYDAAKEKQGMLEANIRELESALAYAEVIDISTLSGTRVSFGATVTLCDEETDEEVTYTIVGVVEADVQRGLISVSAPLARAMIGKEADDEIQVHAPGGLRSYTILSISFRG